MAAEREEQTREQSEFDYGKLKWQLVSSMRLAMWKDHLLVRPWQGGYLREYAKLLQWKALIASTLFTTLHIYIILNTFRTVHSWLTVPDKVRGRVRSQMRYSLTLRIALSTRFRSRAIACVLRASSLVNCAVVRAKLISIISLSASVHFKLLSAYL